MRRWRVSALGLSLLVSACGRIGFGALDDGGAGGGGGGGGDAHHDAKPVDAANLAIPVVTVADSSAPSATVTTLAMTPANFPAGGLAIVAITIAGDGAVTSVADTAGNSYVSAGSIALTGATNGLATIFYAENVKDISGQLVTVTFNAASNAAAWMLDVTGIATTSAFDQAEHATGAVGATITAPGLTTTTWNELLFSLVHTDGSVNGLMLGSPFNPIGAQSGDNGAYLTTSIPGPFTGPVWDPGGGTNVYCAITAAFRAAPL